MTAPPITAPAPVPPKTAPTLPNPGARLIAGSLAFPTSLAFDDEGRPHVAESGLPFGLAPGEARPTGRILRIEPDGSTSVLIDGLRAPVNGLLACDGAFIVAEGGRPGRLSRVSRSGTQETPRQTPIRETLLDHLPGFGNYHTNMAVLGADRRLYFSQGALTNNGIVGLDAYELGWLGELPHDADIPGFDITLTGVEVETADPLRQARGEAQARANTGAFACFGESHGPGHRLPAQVPATAAVLRCNLDGSSLEVFAWGLRNAYGLCVLPDGRLLATDQGADDRGSRPIGNAPDLLYEVKQGRWYGWPDFVGGVPVSDPRFRPTRRRAPEAPEATLPPLLANHDELPPPERPLLEFPVNAAATKLARIPDVAPRWPGHLLVTLFGDEKPMTAPPGARIGRSLARIDPADWSLHPVRLPDQVREHLERPIDVALDPTGETVWLVDFGAFEMTDHGVQATPRSGALWRIPLVDLFP